MRLIDASKFDLKGAEITWLEQRDYAITAHKEKIYKIPTVDAAPVKHGEWVEEEDRVNHWHCSECGSVWGLAHKVMKHCPNCGAKMDLEE